MIFKLYWKDGKSELVQGDSISDAFMKAGYSRGAMKALDFYSDNPDEKYEYNNLTGEWSKVKG